MTWLILPVLVALCPCATAWTQEPQQLPEPVGAGGHGSLQSLAERLITAPDRERRLQMLQVELASARFDTALELLTVLLSERGDAFLLDTESATVGSLNQQIVETLQQAPDAFRRRWNDSQSLVGSIALTRALQDRDSGAVRDVARRFVLTQTGLQAELVLAVQFMERGDDQQVLRTLRRIEQTYSADRRFERRLVDLRSSVQRWQSRATAPRDGLRRPAEMFPSFAAAASAPWPQPIWSWSQAVDDYQLMLPLSERMANAAIGDRALQSFCNWRPLILPELVILRSPFQLVALNRTSGELLWSIPTDTRLPGKGQTPALTGTSDDLNLSAQSDTASLLPPEVPTELADRAAFGMLTADDDYLYFVDGFDVTDTASAGENRLLNRFQPRRGGGGLPGGLGRGNRGMGFGPGLLFQDELDADLVPDRGSMGTRLVALKWDRDHSQVNIAWMVGETTDFDYRVNSPASPSRVTSLHAGPSSAQKPHDLEVPTAALPGNVPRPVRLADDAASTTNPFTGHQFLTAPVSLGTMLFVMTGTDQEQVLNCLDRSTGSLLWRQALVYDDSIPLEFLTAPTAADTATSVYLHHDTVICSLANGTVVCLRQSDGRVEWATSLRDEQTPSTIAPYATEASYGHEAIAFFSLKNTSLLIGACKASSRISAIDLNTGRIRWQVSRQAYGAGIGSTSEDLYAAGIDDQLVILVGEQHCRGLDCATGMQRWVVEISPSTGRAWCVGDVCLIPEVDGLLARIDLNTGEVHRVISQLLPPQSAEIRGSVWGDDELVFVSTTSSMTAFSRCDTLTQRLGQLDSLQNIPARRQQIHAQAQLLDGDPGRAVQTLMDGPQQMAMLSESPEAQAFAAELIMHLAAQSLFRTSHNTEATTQGASQPDAAQSSPEPRSQEPVSPQHTLRQFSRDQIVEYLRLLSSFSLDTAQQHRFRIFLAIADPAQTDWSQLLTRMTNAQQRLQISVDGDWQVNPRQLILAELAGGELLGGELHGGELHGGAELQSAVPGRNSAGISSSDRSSFSLLPADARLSADDMPSLAIQNDVIAASREQFADALLFPRLYGNGAGLLQLAEHAMARNDLAAAEMLLLCVLRDLSDDEPELQTTCLLKLASIRGISVATAQQIVSPDSTVMIPHQSDLRSQLATPLPVASSVLIEDEQVLRTPDSLSSEISAFRNLIDMPKTVSGTWMTQAMDERQQVKILSGFSLVDGSCTDRISLGHDYQTAGARLDAPYSPALMLLSDRERLAAISCVQPGQARLLWESTSRDPVPSLSRQLATGPAGPDFLIWRSATRLHCSHPLTGHELWSRRCAHFTDVEQLFSSELLFGNRNIVVVMDPAQGSYRRYRTTDGRALKPGMLQNLRLDGCMTIEHKLLCTDSYGRILLMDMATETNLLETQEAVFVAGSEPMFRQISDGMVVAVSNAQELVLIDTHRNLITARLPISGFTNTRFVFGLTAWQSAGRLYVNINDEQAMAQTYVAIPRMGEPRLNYGVLLCIDAEAPRILWSRRVDPFVVAQVDGDAAPMLLLWSHVMPAEAAFNRSFRSQRKNRLLRVQVLNSATGDLLAERNNLQPAYPIRCTYDAAQGKMQLFSHDSIVTVTHRNSRAERNERPALQKLE